MELLTDTATAESVQQNIQYFPDPPVQAFIPSPPACFLQLPRTRQPAMQTARPRQAHVPRPLEAG